MVSPTKHRKEIGMTQVEQIALATEKVTRWTAKHEHARAMLTKWKHRLTALEAKGKPQPTATKLPPLVMVPSTDDPKVVPLKGKAKPSPKGKPKK
jgi:hypothetical protein